MDQSMKYLAVAIVFATIVFAVMFRYEFSANGGIRSDRWTGRTELECGVNGERGWMTQAECNASQR